MASQDLGGLKACSKYDFDKNVKGQLTGWGIISKERQKKGISRKEKRKAKNG